MDCGAKVTLCGRSGTVRYWARVGSLICPSEKVSTLPRKRNCYIVGKLVFSFIIGMIFHDTSPDVVSPAGHQPVEGGLGGSGRLGLPLDVEL